MQACMYVGMCVCRHACGQACMYAGMHVCIYGFARMSMHVFVVVHTYKSRYVLNCAQDEDI